MNRREAANELELAGLNQLCMCHGDGVDFAIKLAVPEVDEFIQYRKFWRNVQLLPDEALQQFRVVGHVIEDFRRGETVVSQLFFKVFALGIRHTPLLYSRNLRS